MRTLYFFTLIFFAISLTKVEAQDIEGLMYIKDGLKSRRVSSYDTTGDNHDNIPRIKKGEKFTIFNVKGSGIIKHIWITFGPQPNGISRNDIIIRMYWDDKDYPSVESPIGPFFGQGWNESYLFTSALLAAAPVNGQALVSYFPMPFEKGARIEIENQAAIDIEPFYFYIDYEEMKELPSDIGRFHAWYNREITVPAEGKESEHWIFGANKPNKKGNENYVIADIKGKGHFVGINYYVHSPTPYWYGEGDDMIFIDGDTLPTLHGTGTEDYFNTSWGAPDVPYSTPLFGYAKVNESMGYMGRTHLYRFNVTDPIYFDESLKFTIEHGSNNVLTLDLASVAYWYMNKATPIPLIPNVEERKQLPLIGPAEIHKWRNEWRKNKKNNTSIMWGNE